MTYILQDLRYAARQVARHPVLSAIIVLTIGLGVGAATTAFSILDTVAWRPPPYPAVDRLVAVYAAARTDGQNRGPLDVLAVEELTRSGMFDAALAYAPRGVNVAGTQSTERVNGVAISDELFGLLGANLVAGRTFTAAEYAEGAHVALLGHELAARLFDPGVTALGAVVQVDGQPHTVVGIAPEGLAFPPGAGVWMPLSRAVASSATPQVWAIARLRKGVTSRQADTALATVVLTSGSSHAGDRVLRVTSLHESLLSGKHQAAATALLLASGLVLLVACINLAGLVLATLSTRRTELALRAACGAKRSRLVRLIMTESLMLSAVGGLLGALLATRGVRLFEAALGTPAEAAWLDYGVHGRSVLFAVGVAALTSLVVGFVPAMRASRADIRGILLEGSGQVSGGPGRRHRRVMAVAQIAISLALVAGASSVIASSVGLERAPTGFDPEGLIRARVSLNGEAYADATERLAFVDRASAALAELPGVQAVSAASHVPIIDRRVPSVALLIAPDTAHESQGFASTWYVSSGHLETMRIPIVSGRSLSEVEARDPAARVALISQTMARRYWVDGDAIGRRVRLRGADSGDIDVTVLGIVSDVAQRLATASPHDLEQAAVEGSNQVYLPLAHAREVSLVVRTTGGAAPLTPRLLTALGGIDAALPVSVQTMEAAYAWYVWDRRAQGLVLGVLGGVALLLSALGILGVMSLMVAHRRREIGLRLALGGTPAAIRRLVLAASLRLTAAGLVAGLLLGTLVTTGLSIIFVGVQPFDVRLFLFAATLLLVVAVAATWFPARRAMDVDPMTVVKSERS